MSMNGVSVPPERVRAAEAVAAVLTPGRRVVLTTHVNADGDGVGSEVALWHLLTARGLRATIANPTPIPERFHFLLPEGADHSDRAAREIAEADVVVVLDISEVSRLGDLARAITQSQAVACIDHHVSVGSLPGGPRLVAPEAAATAELVFDFASALQWPLCPEAARALYVGILTDTGGFRFANTTPRVLRVAGALLEHGVDPESIYESVYASAPEGRVRLTAEVLATLVVEPERGLAWVTVPPDALQRHRATAAPHPPQEVAPRERTGDGRIAPPAPVQLVDSLAQLDQEVELVAQPCRALLHAPAVLAKQHPRLERQHPPQRIHHRVHVFVGAEVAEPGGEIQVAREEPAALGLEQGHVVGCVAGGVNYPEPESRRLEALAERRGGGRRPGAPGDAAVQLGVSVRDGESRYANRVCQGGNPQLGREQAVVSGVILVVMGGDTLPHREVGNQPSHVVGEVGRARVHEQPVDEIDVGPVDRPSQHGAGHPEIAHVAVVEA